MITRVWAEKFRCLRSVDIPLRPFQILVGPNGSGKSAFMDVLGFLRTLIFEYLEPAVQERTDNFQDLVWGRQGSGFTLGVEAAVPQEYQFSLGGETFTVIRYEVSVGLDTQTEVVRIDEEKVTLRSARSKKELPVAAREGKDALYNYQNGSPGFRTEIQRVNSILRQAPFTETNFPSGKWLTNLLMEGIRPVTLDPKDLRAPSPPKPISGRILTGTHLARFVAELEAKSDNARRIRFVADSFPDWIKHLRTCLPDLETVRTVLRPEDRHRYLMVRFRNGIEVPSWTLSDGTLRLMALTVLAYMPRPKGIYLIEEPENGLHPAAIDAIYQSLSSIYEGQVLMASHSPILLSLAKPEELLCFTRADEGTQIISGDEHPRLRDWKGEVNLSDLFAAGVLG